jgi:Trypsin-co-occurring domain 2
MLRLTSVALLCASLSACGSMGWTHSSSDNSPVGAAHIASVFARVKQEVALFLEDGIAVEDSWPELRNRLGVQPVCGSGKIQFDIKRVEMTFQVENETSETAGVGLKVPVFAPPIGGSISPSAKFSASQTSTKKVVYNYYPPTLKDYRQAKERSDSGASAAQLAAVRKTALILPTLDNTRDGLIKATAYYPCFRNTNDSDPVDEVSFEVVLVKDSTADAGFNFYFVSLDASGGDKNTGTNTITVYFKPSNADAKIKTVAK